MNIVRRLLHTSADFSDEDSDAKLPLKPGAANPKPALTPTHSSSESSSSDPGTVKKPIVQKSTRQQLTDSSISDLDALVLEDRRPEKPRFPTASYGTQRDTEIEKALEEPELYPDKLGSDHDFKSESDDKEEGDLADAITDARPRKKSSVTFNEAGAEVFTISRDPSQVDFSSLLSNDKPAPLSSDSDEEDLLASPVRSSLPPDPMPASSTPLKGTTLGSLPSLGLSPLGQLPNLGENKKPVKKKAAKSGKTKGKKKKKVDSLLGLLGGDDIEDEDIGGLKALNSAVQEGKKTIGDISDNDKDILQDPVAASLPSAPPTSARKPMAKVRSASSSGAEDSDFNQQKDDVPGEPSTSSDFPGGNLLSSIRQKHPLKSVMAPSLSSSEDDSEVDSIGRRRGRAPANLPVSSLVSRQSQGYAGASASLKASNMANDPDTSSLSSLGEAKPLPPVGQGIRSEFQDNNSLSPSSSDEKEPAKSSSPAGDFHSSPSQGSLSDDEDSIADEISAGSLTDEDLNRVDADTLATKKEEMNVGFEAHRIKPGDADFQYDIEEDFGDPDNKEQCGWDDDDDGDGADEW